MSIIEIKNLSKIFHASSGQNLLALNNISLQIAEGEVQGIIGMSGAGKSTLIRCLVGLEKPTSGEILFRGENIVNLSDQRLRDYRSKIGMVFQNFHLFPCRTVAENIAYPMELYYVPKEVQKKRITELLGLVHLEHKRDVYPARLSGGEKQRIGIARALANHPDILFCDEATSALDATTMGSLLELLRELNQKLGVTIVAITHQLEVVKQICSHVAVLSHGEIVEKGSVAAIFNLPKHAVTRQLLQSELPSLPADILAAGQRAQDLYRLTFQGSSVKHPIISQLLRSHNVEVNILQANIDGFQTTTIGFLLIELLGEESDCAQALQFLSNNHIHWEKVV